jgi:hypothetical protein
MKHSRVRSLRALSSLAALSAMAAATTSLASDPASPLSRKIAMFEAREKPLADVLQSLADLGHLNLTIDWRTLELAGYTKDAPVSLHIRNLPVGKALQAALSQVVTDGNDIGIRLNDGVVTITTAAKLNENLVTRVYDMGELLFDPQEELPNLLDSSTTPQAGSGSTYVQREGGTLFSGGSGGSNSPQQQEQQRTTKLEALRQLIMDTVQPEIWDAHGGTAKITILAWKQALVITAPESVHGDIARLRRNSR